MVNKASEGKNLIIEAAANIAAGDVMIYGKLIGIAIANAQAGEQVAIATKGCYRLPKAAESFADGERLFWNDVQKELTTNFENGVFIGHCLEAADSGNTIAIVCLAGVGFEDAELSNIALRVDDLEDKGNLVIIRKKNYFPAAVGGVITLAANKAYFIAGDIDLEGDRLECAGVCMLFGSSSETSYLTSTGLPALEWLVSSDYTLPIQNITFKDVERGVLVNGDADTALDWTGVNFLNIPNAFRVNVCSNFVFTKGALLNSGGVSFDGEIQTIAFNNSLFSTPSGTAIAIAATAIITRRFRIIYSSFVLSGGTIGIDVNALATIPSESYILDTVNFSGAGTYLAGIGASSNTALFVNCKGIANTAVNGQMYMRNNATATTISNTTNYFKVAGTTTASVDNAKYIHANNRLTNDAVIARKFLIQASLSFNSGNNHVCEFGFYDSKLGAVRQPSITKSTANASGRAENVTFQCAVEHSQGDYLEIHCRNTSATTAITVTDMNVLITQFN